jgi:hypothetical protein
MPEAHQRVFRKCGLAESDRILVRPIVSILFLVDTIPVSATVQLGKTKASMGESPWRLGKQMMVESA